MEGKTAAALEQLRVEAALDPSDAETARLLRDIPLFERNPQDPSVEELRRFLAKVHLDASRALLQRGKNDRAAAELQRALELAPDLAGSR
jgi:tetratricopeptide (TPR) repeat protein